MLIACEQESCKVYTETFPPANEKSFAPSKCSETQRKVL